MVDNETLEQRLKDKDGEIARLRSANRLLTHQLDGAELLLERYRLQAQEDTIGAPWAFIILFVVVFAAASGSAWWVLG